MKVKGQQGEQVHVIAEILFTMAIIMLDIIALIFQSIKPGKISLTVARVAKVLEIQGFTSYFSFIRTPRALPSGRTPRALPSGRTPRALPSGRTPRALPSRRTPRAHPAGRTRPASEDKMFCKVLKIQCI